MTLEQNALRRIPHLKEGMTRLLSSGDVPEVGLDFKVCRLSQGSTIRISGSDVETAVLVFSGSGSLETGGRIEGFRRDEWIHTSPVVAHCCFGNAVTVTAAEDSCAEVLVVQTPNSKRFPSRLYTADEVQIEHRGKGILQDSCYRIVRLVFDDQIAPPESNLVLGEVVNFPGRWSSYPPHHHPQPEIYYYRFEPSQGYGHAELGEQVFKVRDGDLVCITDGRVHSQVSAPGYHMYYLWAIRHLKEDRYRGFTFDPAHEWTLDAKDGDTSK